MPGARHYTEEQQAFLRERATTMSRRLLAEAFNKRYGTHKTESAIRMQCKALGLPTAPRGAWKQGKRGEQHWATYTEDGRRRSEKALQRAHEANRKHHDGDRVITKGRAFIYREDPEKQGKNKYRMLSESTVNWEAANGRPVKPKHRLVHLDGDKLNNDPDNLREVPWALLALIRDLGGLTDNRELNEAKLEWAALKHALGKRQKGEQE